MSGAACAAAVFFCSACVFSTRSSVSAILPICVFCAVLDVVTLVFSAARLSLSDFVVPRSCATVSFSAFTSSATWSFVTAATGGGAEVNIGPNLATPSEPPIAPKLAAIATQAASSAKRARACAARCLSLRLGAP